MSKYIKTTIAISFFCYVGFVPEICSANNPPQGDALIGKTKATVCIGCHSPNGVSQIPDIPNLCGQKYHYLVKALTAYKNKAREDITMNALIADKSDEDIRDLSAFYSNIRCP